MYYDFLVALNSDKEVFKEVYFEILAVCIEYIQEHLTESHTIAISDHSNYSNYNTPEEFLKILSENIEKTEQKKKESLKNKDCVEEFKKEINKLYNED